MRDNGISGILGWSMLVEKLRLVWRREVSPISGIFSISICRRISGKKKNFRAAPCLSYRLFTELNENNFATSCSPILNQKIFQFGKDGEEISKKVSRC